MDPYQYQYRNPTFQRNWQLPKTYNGQYSTDVVAEKSLAFLDDAVASTKPFFLTVAPIAPHVEVNVTIDFLRFTYSLANGPPVPAERHAGLFSDVQVPRTDNFNPDTVRYRLCTHLPVVTTNHYLAIRCELGSSVT